MIDSQSQKISNMNYIVFNRLSLNTLLYACCPLIFSILKNLTLFDIIIKIRLWPINFSGWMPFVYSRQINCTCIYGKQYIAFYRGLSRARLPISWQQYKIIKVRKAITKLQLMCRPWSCCMSITITKIWTNKSVLFAILFSIISLNLKTLMQRLNIPSVCWASIIFCYNKLKNKNFCGNTARSAPPATIFAVVWAPHAHFHFICGLMLPGDRQLAAVQVTNWNNKNNNSGSNNNINNNNNNNNNSAQHFLALNTTQKSAKMNVYLYVQMKIFIYARGRKNGEKQLKKLNWKQPNENWGSQCKFRVIWRSWLTVLSTMVGNGERP